MSYYRPCYLSIFLCHFPSIHLRTRSSQQQLHSLFTNFRHADHMLKSISVFQMKKKITSRLKIINYLCLYKSTKYKCIHLDLLLYAHMESQATGGSRQLSSNLMSLQVPLCYKNRNSNIRFTIFRNAEQINSPSPKETRFAPAFTNS